MIFKKNNPGFTLVELTVVLMIVCFLSAATMGLFVSLRSIVIKADLELLEYACWFQQQKALATGEQQMIHFDENQNRYHVDTTVEDLSSGVTFGIGKKLLGSPGNPVRFVQKPVTFVANRMIFYPNGSMSAGSVYLKTDQDQNYAFTSAVSPVASLRMYRCDTKGWKRIDE